MSAEWAQTAGLKPVFMHQFCLLALLFALVINWAAGLHSCPAILQAMHSEKPKMWLCASVCEICIIMSSSTITKQS